MRALRIAVLTAAVALAGAATAHGVVAGTPDFTLAAFTKPQAGAGGALGLTMRWTPVSFVVPTGAEHYEVTLAPLPAGTPQTSTAEADATSLGPLTVQNGQALRVTVAACQQPSCTLGSPSTAEVTADTTIDATPPSGTVVIDRGAAATNDRNVALTLTADDPLIDGRAGTSSGVTQFAVDVDGDGTVPCEPPAPGGDPPDRSGCAQDLAATATATLPPGDGIKTLGVTFGDGARAPSAPCPAPCAASPGQILGNVSAPATDTILLDTIRPVARMGQDAITVQRGDAAVFDAASSTDSSPVSASGIDFPATAWDFNDGTPAASGSRVSHAFGRIGTFVGRLRVRDRAGNVSDPKAFTVTVDPRAGETIDGYGSIAGVRGSAAFSLTQIGVSARYSRSRLSGSILVQGVSSLPGTITVTIRPTGGGRALASVRGAVAAASFARGLRLPPTLLPGTYDLSVAGPGGTLQSTLTLRPPREGVASSATVRLRGGPVARFVFATPPIARLRSKLTVTWAQGRTRLGIVKARAGRTVTAGPPRGAVLRPGPVTATLRAGTAVVAVASARVG
ncbi:MAG TPA: PKD domain-containing protein [Miltoncostaeaceae bacterium]|nr:PKD domain-containing protein [Miltoncostaeaceae bacterium]